MFIYWRAILFSMAMPLGILAYWLYLRFVVGAIFWDFGSWLGYGAYGLIALGTALPVLVVQFGFAAVLWRWIQKHPLKRTGRVLLSIFLFCYMLTVVVGIPVAHNDFTRHGMEYFAQLHSGETMTEKTHPHMSTYCAVPVLPFVILHYREAQYAGLNGWGGWSLTIWHVTGTKDFDVATLWVS